MAESKVLVRRKRNGLYGFADFHHLICEDVESIVLDDLNFYPGVNAPITNTMQLLQALANLQAQITGITPVGQGVVVGITAGTGGQAGATKTTGLENFISVCPSGGGVYALPALPDTRQIFHNAGTHAVIVYPFLTGGDNFI